MLIWRISNYAQYAVFLSGLLCRLPLWVSAETELGSGLVRFAGLIWDWQDEPESLILAQSERWRHA
jgi:hypothetical protein